MKNREVAIVSVGLHPWGVWENKSQREMGVEAITTALAKANMDWREIQFMVSGSPIWTSEREGLNSSLSATAVELMMGGTGIPALSVSHACATGTACLYTAYLAVASGEFDTVLAMAADKSAGGFFRPQSRDPKFDNDYQRYVMTGQNNPSYWAAEIRRRMYEVGTTEDDLAMIKAITSKAGVHNPYARYKKVFTKQEVLNSPYVSEPLRLFEICATSDGAGAMIVTTLDKAWKYTKKPVLIDAVSMGTSAFGDQTIRLYELSTFPQKGVPALTESRSAIRQSYAMASRRYHRHLPEDLDIIEVPDNTSWHYLVYLDCILGLQPGEAEKMLRKGVFDPIDGKLPVCPSGGISASGEAVVAQGIYQINSLVDQLRGEAGKAQVKKDVKVALAQSYGYAGNNGVCILSRGW